MKGGGWARGYHIFWNVSAEVLVGDLVHKQFEAVLNLEKKAKISVYFAFTPAKQKHSFVASYNRELLFCVGVFSRWANFLATPPSQHLLEHICNSKSAFLIFVERRPDDFPLSWYHLITISVRGKDLGIPKSCEYALRGKCLPVFSIQRDSLWIASLGTIDSSWLSLFYLAMYWARLLAYAQRRIRSRLHNLLVGIKLSS